MPPEELQEEELAQALTEESSEEPVPEEGIEEEAAPVEEPAPPEEDYLTIGERSYNRSTAEAMADLYGFLEANPNFSKAMAAYATGQFELVPRGAQSPEASQPAESPEDDDPVISELRKEISSLREMVGSQSRDSHMAAISTAANSFREAHGLSEAEMSQLMRETERLQILPAIAAEVDPFGQPKHDSISAATEAFDRVYWATPEFREREIAKVQGASAQDHRRQRRHAALGGTSGSVPRTNPEPKNQDEAFTQMVAELEALGRGE